MSEREPGFDFFSQSAALVESLCELQRGFADEFFDRFRHGDNKNTVVETATECCRNVFNGIANNPHKVVERQLEHWQLQLQLSSNLLRRLLGEAVEPVVQPQPSDRRFDNPEWSSNPLFDYIKQSYLLTAENALQMIAELEGVEARDRERLSYFMRQLISALAPTNFALTNPDVLRRTLETQGSNLVDGLRMMVEDKKRSADILNVCVSQPDAFKVGVNLAHTPGAVVAENELMQLIQYTPVTPKVQTVPILIVPSWVNKYYVLDLSEKNSFIRWLVAQGYTVFTISWINPDASHRSVQFSDYLRRGPLFAAAAIESITGAPQVAGVGYCLGGILLACALAYGERVEDQRFASATYLAASIDFRNAGDIGIFVDENLVKSVERQMQRHGYLDGRLLSAGFSLLKENDLYWNYYVTNYLKGERPSAFDLLHWNSDSTNVPEATHRFILRELHLQNRLIKSREMMIDGCAIDLRDIVTPTYVLATDKDHIANWQSCYAAMQLQRGPARFVLAGSGHIAGVINPPSANKYYYYATSSNHTFNVGISQNSSDISEANQDLSENAHGRFEISNDAFKNNKGTLKKNNGTLKKNNDTLKNNSGTSEKVPAFSQLSADEWLKHAQRFDGSWWCDWERWQRALTGPECAAREIRSTDIIEPAPGRYVLRRLDSTENITERSAA